MQFPHYLECKAIAAPVHSIEQTIHICVRSRGHIHGPTFYGSCSSITNRDSLHTADAQQLTTNAKNCLLQVSCVFEISVPGRNTTKFRKSKTMALNTWSYATRYIMKVIVPGYLRRVRHGNTTEERLLEYVKSTAVQGDAASVLSAVDKFKAEKEWMMHFQYEKRQKIDGVLKKTKPQNGLELGTYVGYSAIATSRHLSEGGHLISVEIDKKNASLAKQFIEFAGVSNQISIAVGKSSDIIPELRSKYSVDKLDYVFLDHWNSLFLPDLKLLKKHGLLRKGSVIVADNVLYPGSPDYLQYVENSGEFTTERFDCYVQFMRLQDAIAISVYNGD
ncbi:catechol O-methyltransferase-like [Acanthaster planci]|uniref:catechol O-methyltransferase n=1 Tax=Acanthaster planci TaxID=133434 RepID=A0A8B7YC38_ACAPL|nr:catechol O-methyltransferase-like [Acanthaster planci]